MVININLHPHTIWLASVNKSKPLRTKHLQNILFYNAQLNINYLRDSSIWGGGTYSYIREFAQLISIKIYCFYGLRTRIYKCVPNPASYNAVLLLNRKNIYIIIYTIYLMVLYLFLFKFRGHVYIYANPQ